MVWSYCKAKVEMKCSCGNLSETVMCMSGANDSTLNPAIQRASSAAVASKTGEGVDITEMMGRRRVLECNEKCAVIERNRRLAEALNLKDAELRPEAGAPQYTEFLKEMARKNPSSVSSIEKGLSNLVQSVQDSKFSSRSHSFPCMNRDMRRMIHELAEFYGCQTQSYDQEPNKNVVALARKDKCRLPNMTLSSVVQRERFPKVPMPIPHHRNMDISSSYTTHDAYLSLPFIPRSPCLILLFVRKGLGCCATSGLCTTP
ncbi:Transcriptional repressor NF-X1 [Holothuria leucospilota]|uniref:Transcriptional repressor NF-X1 n=1 Tax=Holothuria leucospilota TaxID=206669 RepID=A0A9Q1BGK3_HOLLE|nr:Transcriptional repressor NF-X1 [Holothuria leucospilota]